MVLYAHPRFAVVLLFLAQIQPTMVRRLTLTLSSGRFDPAIANQYIRHYGATHQSMRKWPTQAKPSSASSRGFYIYRHTIRVRASESHINAASSQIYIRHVFIFCIAGMLLSAKVIAHPHYRTSQWGPTMTATTRPTNIYIPTSGHAMMQLNLAAMNLSRHTVAGGNMLGKVVHRNRFRICMEFILASAAHLYIRCVCHPTNTAKPGFG